MMKANTLSVYMQRSILFGKQKKPAGEITAGLNPVQEGMEETNRSYYSRIFERVRGRLDPT
jgi:hypothetical protein